MRKEDEASYNTRIFPKETEYTKCENCNGSGFIYDHDDECNIIKEDCPDCENGLIETEN